VIGALRRETEAARSLIANVKALVGDDEDVVASTVEGETNLLEAIGDAMARLAELNGLMDGVAGMIASLKARGERFERQRDLIRDAIALAMETAEVRKLELPMATLSLKSTPQKVEITDESAIPSEFWKPQEPKLDRRGLLTALKAGEQIKGAVLSNGGSSLQVRMQ